MLDKMFTRVALCAAFCAAAAPVSAQFEVGADVGMNSQYIWRGLNIANPSVSQPSVWATVSSSTLSFNAGIWGNVEMSTAAAGDLSLRGGAGLGEVDYFGEVSTAVGSADLAFGAIYYTFQGGPGASDANTFEVYGSVGTTLPLSPSLTVYYDVADVKGAYLEAGIGRAAGAFDLGALAGYSAGQEINPSAPGEVGYFAESGLTHIDFSAATSFDAGSLSIAPAIHFQISGDAATKAITATGTSRAKFWFGFALSWSSILG